MTEPTFSGHGEPAGGAAPQFIADSIDEASAFWARNSGKECHIVLGRSRIALRMMGSSIAEVVLPTLRHAVVDADAEPDAIIYAVDSETAGFPAPPETWPFETDSENGRLRIHWTEQAGPAMSSDESRGIWHLHDRAKGVGLYWIRSARDLPFWEAASPLRHHIHWISMDKAQGMLHAAVVSAGAGGTMLVGRGGSGKSTMTAAALRRGWRVTGDDFVLVTLDPTPQSYPLYDIIKLSGMAETMFDEFSAEALNPDRLPDEKMLARISGRETGNFADRLPITAAFSLRLTGAERSAIQKTSSFEIVSAVAASSSLILRTGLRETFAFTSSLARKVPCYRFGVGRDPLEALDTLEGFMEA